MCIAPAAARAAKGGSNDYEITNQSGFSSFISFFLSPGCATDSLRRRHVAKPPTPTTILFFLLLLFLFVFSLSIARSRERENLSLFFAAIRRYWVVGDFNQRLLFS